MISRDTHKIKSIFVKPNAYKTRWFVVWRLELSQDELAQGLGRLYSRSFNTEAEAHASAEKLKGQ
jgi:hypothetical protein